MGNYGNNVTVYLQMEGHSKAIDSKSLWWGKTSLFLCLNNEDICVKKNKREAYQNLLSELEMLLIT